jgi:hypothetical protein
MPHPNQVAASEGIDPIRVVREGTIALRDKALEENKWHDATLLTHAVWWLAAIEHNLKL